MIWITSYDSCSPVLQFLEFFERICISYIPNKAAIVKVGQDNWIVYRNKCWLGYKSFHSSNHSYAFWYFGATVFICEFHLSWSSTITPIVFVSETFFILLSPNLISASSSILPSLCLEPTIIYSVLLVLSVNLLANNHWCIFSKSLFNLLYNSVDVLPLAVRLVLSANMLAVFDFKQFGKSFTYSRNK